MQKALELFETLKAKYQHDLSQRHLLELFDEFMQKAMTAKAGESSLSYGVILNYVDLMRAVDNFLKVNGFPQFEANERLKGALKYFASEDTKINDFREFLPTYQQIREEIWQTIGS